MSGIKARNRECLEGRVGRNHTYTCRECGNRFPVFLTPGVRLKPRERVCPECMIKLYEINNGG